jgi:hypothetical protein
METLKIQVRQHKDGELHAFFYEGGSLVCFCFSEGHSECCDEWRLKDCKPVEKGTTLDFAKRLENYYNAGRIALKVQVVQNLNVNQV